MGLYVLALVSALCGTLVHGFMPHDKDHFLTDALLREVVDRMSRDLAAAADTYLDSSETNAGYLGPMKGLDSEEASYPVDLEGLVPPSLRDREFLQHSSLYASQLGDGDANEGLQRHKPDGSLLRQQQIKTDPTLPAYCNPPNPCPVGYQVEDGCLMEFENTAAFSRKFQSAMECMCDTEHMFDCPVHDYDSMDMDNAFISELSDADHHKNLVAKKFHSKKSSNPYLQGENPYLLGEKLPIAAKKGHKLPTD